MKKIIIFIISVLSLISCHEPKTNKTNILYFNLYNNKDINIESNIYTLKRIKLNLFDSIIVFKKKEKVLSYKEVFDKNGIYRYVLNKKTLTHSLKDSTTLITKYNVSYLPFINKKATLINEITYKLGENNYKIFHYSEVQNNHTSFDSYYLENVGFICYYNFDTDKYILCDSTNIKSLKIKEITSKLVKDETFFARFTVAKLFPNYYRENNNLKGI